MNVLRLSHINVSFGGVQVLRDLDLALDCGERLGLIGVNGSGKTTMFALIGGQIRQPKGHVWLGEVDIGPKAPTLRARIGIARMFQESRLWEDLSGAEHLQMMMDIKNARNVGMPALMNALQLDRTILARRVSALPLFERRRIEMCISIFGARVLLCDEIAGGLNRVESRSLYGVVDEAVKQGWIEAALLIEHKLDLLAEHSSFIATLEEGRIKRMPIKCLGSRVALGARAPQAGSEHEPSAHAAIL